MNRVIFVECGDGGVMTISLREHRKKELKEGIFTQAIRLFNERGFGKVTIEDITSACGIAKGTFYNYFPRKEHILLHLGQTQLALLKESIERHAGVKDIRERLKLMFMDLTVRYDKDPCLLKAAVIEIMRSSELEQELQLEEEARLALVPLFEAAIRDGQVSGRWSPDQLSLAVVGMYNHIITTWLKETGEGDLLTIFNMYLDILWYGIGKRKGEAVE